MSEMRGMGENWGGDRLFPLIPVQAELGLSARPWKQTRNLEGKNDSLHC